MKETKPFYLTSEFYVSLITGATMFGNEVNIWHLIPKSWGAIALAIIGGLYANSRGNAKSGVAYQGPGS